jgi:hypothetical protein
MELTAEFYHFTSRTLHNGIDIEELAPLWSSKPKPMSSVSMLEIE